MSITNWDEFDRELARITENKGRTPSRADELLDRSLGINATPTEAAEAQRKLAEVADRPWRLEWPASERLTRRGEEAQLAELYMSRLGESRTAAEAHVHSELSAAWNGRRDLADRLAFTRGRLASERARMEAKRPLTETRRESRGPARPQRIRENVSRIVEVRETSKPNFTPTDRSI